MAKRMHTSLRGQATPQSAAIYRNLRQFIVIYGNLPVPIALPGTVTTGTIAVRKEGRTSAYIDVQTA
jgi:hypothetical protein